LKKQPIIYKNQVIGYIDYLKFIDGKIEVASIYLFRNELYDEVVGNIKRGSFATFDSNPNTEVLTENNLYDIKLENDLLTIKLK